MPAIITTPAARGLNTLGRPAKAPKAYTPRPSVPLKSFLFRGDGTGRVVSGHSGAAYELFWTPRADRFDVLSCGCVGCFRYAACDHMVQSQAVLDGLRPHVPAGSVLTGAWDYPGNCTKADCKGRLCFATCEDLGGRGTLRFAACTGCIWRMIL